MKYICDLIKDQDLENILELLKKVQDPAVKEILKILIKEPGVCQRSIDKSMEEIVEIRKETEKIMGQRGIFGMSTSV